MLRLILAFVLSAFLLAPPALAQDDAEPAILTPREISELSLDQLFDELKATAKTPVGQRIEREIVRRFNKSGSATADLLLSWAANAMEKKDYSKALDLLDQVVIQKPDFAEAWNRRATVYYMLDDYSASLSDIRTTLAIEPRHFGALAGFGIILQSLDRKDEAIEVFRRALEINPQLDNVRESLDRLEKENADREI
jgi:tetratricopeptide (TPR) repeat protein